MLRVNEIGKVAIHGPLQKRLAAPKSRMVWIGPFKEKNSQHPYLIGNVMSARLMQHSKKLESFFPANLSEAAQLSKRCSARCSTQLATIKQNHCQSDRV
jgi:hypothetical protein